MSFANYKVFDNRDRETLNPAKMILVSQIFGWISMATLCIWVSDVNLSVSSSREMNQLKGEYTRTASPISSLLLDPENTTEVIFHEQFNDISLKDWTRHVNVKVVEEQFSHTKQKQKRSVKQGAMNLQTIFTGPNIT